MKARDGEGAQTAASSLKHRKQMFKVQRVAYVQTRSALHCALHSGPPALWSCCAHAMRPAHQGVLQATNMSPPPAGHTRHASPSPTGLRPGTSNKIKTASGKLRPRTFTAHPAVTAAARQPRGDLSHTETELAGIAVETRSLVDRLKRVYGRPPGQTSDFSAPAPAPAIQAEAHAARNRCLQHSWC